MTLSYQHVQYIGINKYIYYAEILKEMSDIYNINTVKSYWVTGVDTS